MPHGPAYRLVTERLVVRALEPRDAAELARVIADNAHHLRPWIEWAREGPRTEDAALDATRRMRGRFDLSESFAFAITEARSARIVGGAVLAPNPVEASASIGYWLAQASTGQGFATETVLALVRVAFEVENLELVEIQCAADNERSALVARRAGFTHDGTLRARLRSEDGTRTDRASFSILKAEYPRSPAARAVVTAHDALDRVVLGGPTSTTSRSPFR
jgi:RimJ/RimL family protein N-acetyltransferase